MTPGTVTEEALLEERRESLLMAVHQSGETIEIAVLDLGSGLFGVSEAAGGERLAAEIGRLRPAEILVSEGSTLLREPCAVRGLDRRPPWHFDAERAGRTLAGHFGADLSAFGCEDVPAALRRRRVPVPVCRRHRTFLPVYVTRPAPVGSRPGIRPSPDSHPELGRDRPKRALTALARAPGSPAGHSDVTVPVAKQR